jgi:hypothetical protein
MSHLNTENPQPASNFITDRELARLWRKAVRTLQRYRCDGTGPAFLKIGGSIFYREGDIAAFERGATHAQGPARD